MWKWEISTAHSFYCWNKKTPPGCLNCSERSINAKPAWICCDILETNFCLTWCQRITKTNQTMFSILDSVHLDGRDFKDLPVDNSFINAEDTFVTCFSTLGAEAPAYLIHQPTQWRRQPRFFCRIAAVYQTHTSNKVLECSAQNSGLVTFLCLTLVPSVCLFTIH